MNSNDKVKNDFIFFQNEVLRDLKKIESKFAEKIMQLNNTIGEQNLKTETKIQDLISRLEVLSNQIQEKKNSENPLNIIQPIKQKIDENVTKLEMKVTFLQKDFDNACFRYDKIISNNLSVPGIIGSSCPYESLRPFIEFVNIKITELSKAKDKQILDLKKYKEKLETIIANNKKQMDTSQKQINDYCKNGLKQCDNNCIERINVVEKRIENLRIENGEFAYNLKKRSEELKIEWDKLDMVDKNLNKRYTEEVAKFSEIMDKIGKKVEKNKEEFNLIKLRFIELSEFIKDVRFRRNIHNTFQERKQYKEISSKIDFTRKQQLKSGEGDNEGKDNNNLQDYLAPFDYYAHFGISPISKEGDEIINEEENNNTMNTNNVNNININSDDNKKSNGCKLIENYMKMNNNTVRNSNKLLNYNINKTTKNNLKEVNLYSGPEIKSKNIFNSSMNKSQKYLDINKKLLMSAENSTMKKIIISSNNDLNNNSQKKMKDNGINIKELNNKEKKNFPNLKENTKINELILSVKLNKKSNSNNNLGQSSYLLMKKRIEEMQTIRKIYGVNNNHKHRISSSPPPYFQNDQIKKRNKRKNNYKLNQFNVLSNKDFKKGNIEDLYYNQLITDKKNEISKASSQLYLRSASKDDNINYRTINKKIYPKNHDNQKIFNSSVNDKNSIHSSFIESNQHFSNNNFIIGDLLVK